MIERLRLAISAGLVTAASVALAAGCGDGQSSGPPATRPPTPSPTSPVESPFFALEPLPTEDILAELTALEGMVSNPDQAIVEAHGIDPTDLEVRIDLALRGVSGASSFDDVRRALEEENSRILAAEYLYDVVLTYLVPPFNEADRSTIEPDTLKEIDPGRVFAQDPNQGMEVSSLYREAVIRAILLWYRI